MIDLGDFPDLHRHRCTGNSVEHRHGLTATLGWTPDDLVGKTGEWLIHPDDREKSFGELVEPTLANPASTSKTASNADGSYRWLSWRSLIANQSSRYAIARDITNFKQTKSNCTRYAASLPNHLVKLRLAP